MPKELKLTEGPILPALIRFSVPIILALFLQAMYGAVDLIVVGQFATTADVSGVATGSSLTGSITIVTGGFAMGVTILLAEAAGMGNKRRAGQILGAGLLLFSVVVVLITIAMTLYADTLARVMEAPVEAFEQTVSYVLICGIGFSFIVAYNFIGSVFRAIGDSKTPLITVAIACVINIALDLLLVIVFQMGAAGAALATVISQGVSVVLSLLMLRGRDLPLEFSLKDLRPNHEIRHYIWKILMLGTPIALQDLLVGISFLFIQMLVNSMGVNESAGVGVAEKVSMFLMLLGGASIQAISAFVAQNMGAGKPERALAALRQGIFISVSTGVVLGLFTFFMGDRIAAIFANDPMVIYQGHQYLKAYAIDCVFMPFLFCLLGYFNGVERTFFVMIQGIVGAFCVRLPIAWFMSHMAEPSLFLIGLSTPIASATQIIMSLIVFALATKKHRRGHIEYHG